MMQTREWWNAVREVLRLLADRNRQVAAWHDGGATPDRVELVCMLFDDLDVAGLLNAQDLRALTGPDTRERLETLVQELGEFAEYTPDSTTSAAVLGTPAWRRIQELAAEILEATA